MIGTCFWIGLGCLGIFVIKLWPWCAHLGVRQWPPQRLELRDIVEIWLVASGAITLTYVVGALEAGRLGWPGWLQTGLGLPMIVLGGVMVSIAMAQLGFLRSSGGKGRLKRTGLYAWFRHPQYFGHMMALSGWALWTGGLWIWVMLACLTGGFWLSIRAEDRWLAAHHGRLQNAYVSRVAALL